MNRNPNKGITVREVCQNKTVRTVAIAAAGVVIYTMMAHRAGYRMVKPMGRNADGAPLMKELFGNKFMIDYTKK